MMKMKWDPLYQVTRCDFMLRDQGTFLGFFWTLLNPALMFTILYTIFSKWFERYIPNFGWHLLIGIIQWNFFAAATTNALTIFERKRNIVRNFAFNKAILPTAAVLVVFVSFVLESLMALFLLAAFGKLSLPGVPVFLVMGGCNLVLSLSVGLMIASLNVFYRDVEHAWGLLLKIGFFVTPVFYPLQLIGPVKLFVIKLNPLYHILTCSREALLNGTLPSAGGLAYLAISLAVLFAASLFVFSKTEPQMAEQL